MDNNGDLIQLSIQSQIREDDYGGLDILPLFLRAGELIPPYWSRARDVELGRFWMREDHVASALGMFASKFSSIPLHIEPRDQGIKTHARQADALTAILNTASDFGQGWSSSFAPRFIMDLLTQDNGAFAEVLGDAPEKVDRITGQRIRDTSQPREGFYGLAHLDSQRCARTSSPIYPVIYQDVSGNLFRLHHTRVIYTSSLPSNRVRLNRVGFCALSRMINTVQHLWDISTMEQEELGSRPKRRIIIAKQGISAAEVGAAFQAADSVMDSQGLRRYSKNVVIGLRDQKPTSTNAIEIDVQDLHSALAGEDKEMSITLGMFLIALALGIPPRWLWPASSTGATKADAMYQHIAGMGGGIGHLLMVIRNLLGGDTLSDVLGKPIGPQFEVVFDYQDDEQDRQQAEIRKLRSEAAEKNTMTGVWTVQVARQQALSAGDITEQQYEDMAMEDGRLSDGQEILNLFYTTDPVLRDMLALSVGDILNVAANDRETVLQAIQDRELEIRAALVNPSRPKEFEQARLAFAALQALRKLYMQPTPQQQRDGLEKIEEQRQQDGQEPE